MQPQSYGYLIILARYYLPLWLYLLRSIFSYVLRIPPYELSLHSFLFVFSLCSAHSAPSVEHYQYSRYRQGQRSVTFWAWHRVHFQAIVLELKLLQKGSLFFSILFEIFLVFLCSATKSAYLCQVGRLLHLAWRIKCL